MECRTVSINTIAISVIALDCLKVVRDINPTGAVGVLGW
jgi:hypothetical protein